MEGNDGDNEPTTSVPYDDIAADSTCHTELDLNRPHIARI